MEHEPIHLVSKWWLRAVALIVATTPAAVVLWLQDAIAPKLAELMPKTLLQIFVVLLLTAFALLAVIILLRPWLRWDEPTGTWLNKFSGIRYCGTCRANKKIVVPLKNEITGWRCVACDKFRVDPARKPKQEESKVVKRERI